MPTILRPTRITQDSATLIDNIFTNALTEHIESAIVIDDLSDHLPIYVVTQTPQLFIKTSPAYVKRIVSEHTLSSFNNLLCGVDWSDVYKACDQGDSNLAYTVFIDKYKLLYERSFEKQVYKPKKRDEIKQDDCGPTEILQEKN